MVNPTDLREKFKDVTGYKALFDVTFYEGNDDQIFDEIYVRILEHIIFHEVGEIEIDSAMSKLYHDFNK